MPRSGSASSPYAPAANLLSQIIDEKKSFKKLVYSKDGTLKCSKVTYAQVCQVLSYKGILDQILGKVPTLSNYIHNSGLLHVLVYELLLGPNQSIRGGGVVKRKLLQHEKELRKALESQDIAQQLQDTSFGAERHSFPRYARVNTLLISLEEVCQTLLSLSSKQQEQDKEGNSSSIEFYIDPHVPDLLVFPPSIVTETMSVSSSSTEKDTDTNTTTASIHQTIKSWIQSGKIILQDKSSCFSAFCLMHGFETTARNENSNYLDACAAPGNKTQHLAALIGDTKSSSSSHRPPPATVYALDRSKERLVSLQRRMQQLVPSHDDDNDDTLSGRHRVSVVAKNYDFLETTPNDFLNDVDIGAILLDPSCSGSGIMTAPDRWTEQQQKSSLAEDKEEFHRVDSLAKFQEKALTHAMTSFPTVSRIVYSTCSLHERENEVVVVKALVNANESTNNHEGGEAANSSNRGWKVVAPKCLEQWNRRGHVVEGLNGEEAKCMIRACAEDETNGFFVCCLERKVTTEDEKSEGRRSDKAHSSCTVQTPKGTVLYTGQFAKVTSKKKPQALSTKLSIQPCLDRQDSDGAEPESTKVKGESKPAKANNNTTERNIPKKVAKRLAWKKRQMEQKQQRLKEKKSRKV